MRTAVSMYYWGYGLRYTQYMYFVYVLRSSIDQQLYVGFSENLDQRLKSHNNGEVTSTQFKRPWERIFYECYTNKADALRREKYLKTTMGKRALKMMLRETLHIAIPRHRSFMFSRQYIDRLVEQGKLRCKQTSTGKVFLFSDVADFQKQRMLKAKRRKAKN